MKWTRQGLFAVLVLMVAAFITVVPVSHKEPKPAASLALRVDLSARELSVIENGDVTNVYPVAIGKPSYPTPTGTFRIRRIIWNPRWVPPDSEWARDKKAREPGDPANPMGKVKIFFSEPDYYIHGTHETDSLGEAESHGCLRMRNADVVTLARKVMNAGGKPVSPGWVRRMVNRIRSTREVRLSEPVTVSIIA
jgi:lipoprotein-anchoring transpeptidase ErfK/SrfK